MTHPATPEPLTPHWRRALASAQAALAAGRFDAAVAALDGASGDPAAPLEALRLLAGAARSAGRPQAAVAPLVVLADRQPASAVAAHNLAAAFGDLDRMAESERAARAALARGGRAPETWLVLARALLGQGRLDEAEAAFRSAIGLKADYYPAHRDLVQLIWMRGADAADVRDALAPLAALGRHDPAALIVQATILKETLGDETAYDSLAPFLRLPHPELLMTAAAAAAGFDPAIALSLTDRALALAPAAPEIRLARLSALVACGQADEAAPGLQDHLKADPGDHYARALLDAAWRVLDDPRALAEDDYRRLVRVFDLEAGADAADRDAWLARTVAALHALHPFQSHPFNQSVRGGAQSRIDPRSAEDADIDRFFAAVRAPVDAYVAAFSADDPSGRLPSPDWRVSGAWSVRLQAGGHHTDHVHRRAWISSAAYLEVPPAADGRDRAGWLRFGAARIGAAFSLPALHWVQPRPGSLVLFPSWLWHGTEPFHGAGERLTIAFDVAPAG